MCSQSSQRPHRVAMRCICCEHLSEKNVRKQNKIKCNKCKQEFEVKDNEFQVDLKRIQEVNRESIAFKMTKSSKTETKKN